MTLISKTPTTARTDVSKNELKLRQLDTRDKMMRAFEVIVLIALVITQIIILFRVLENSSYNRTNIIEQGMQLKDTKKITSRFIRE